MHKGLLSLLSVGLAFLTAGCGSALPSVDQLPAARTLASDWNGTAYTGYSIVLNRLEGEVETFSGGYAAVRLPDIRRIQGFLNEEGVICMAGNYAPSEQRLCTDGVTRQTNCFNGEYVVVKETSSHAAPVYYRLYPDGRKEEMTSYSLLEHTLVAAVPDTDLFIVRSGEGGLYGLADRNNQWHIPPTYALLQYLAPNRYIAVTAVDEHTMRSGIIDSGGQVICDFQYEYLYAADPEHTYPFVFAKLSDSGTGAIQYQVLSYDGLPLLDQPADDVSLSCQSPCIKRGETWYLLAPDGTCRTGTAFDQAVERGDGLRRAKADGKWGYIDESGSFVIPPRFTYADNFSEGIASVSTPAGSGYIDTSGEFIISPKYDYTFPFSSGKALVYTRSYSIQRREGTEYAAAIIDTGGNVLKNNLTASSFVSKVGDYYQLMDENGCYRLYTEALELALISPYEITKVETDSLTGQNVYIVEHQGWDGVVNCMGNVILSPEENLCPSSGLKWLGEGFMNMNGKLIRLESF